MKIDPTIQPASSSQSEAVTSAKKSGAQAPQQKTGATSSSTSGDTFQVSTRQAEIQSLTGQLANVPDVRSERVAPLKAAVQQNNYNPESAQVADAMLRDQSGLSVQA
jgi:flagellar biosynthesis anti-sigma factor FlgM